MELRLDAINGHNSHAEHTAVATSEMLRFADWNEPTGLRSIPLKNAPYPIPSTDNTNTSKPLRLHHMQFMWGAQQAVLGEVMLEIIFFDREVTSLPSCFLDGLQHEDNKDKNNAQNGASNAVAAAFANCKLCDDVEKVVVGVVP